MEKNKTMKHLIFGTGGFAKEVFLILLRNNIPKEDIIYIDKERESEIIQKNLDNNFYMGIGDPLVRKQIFKKNNKHKLNFPNLFDPNCMFIKEQNIIGIGNIFCSNSLVTLDVNIGSFNIFNLQTTIGHDTEIGDFCTFSPGAKISGNSKIHNEVYFGTNSCILERLTVMSKITIGAGAVVTKDLKEEGVYVGIPCKLINKGV